MVHSVVISFRLKARFIYSERKCYEVDFEELFVKLLNCMIENKPNLNHFNVVQEKKFHPVIQFNKSEI